MLRFDTQIPSEDVRNWIKQIDEDIKYVSTKTDILAEKGWIISPEWTLPMIGILLDDEKNIDDLLYSDYYTFNNNEELDNLFNSLKNESDLLFRWHSLVMDCISSYDAGYFRVCIPSLISVIEGLLAMQCGNSDKSKKILNYIDEQISNSQPDVDKMIWISSKSFISKLFSHHEFNDKRPLLINRHRIEHGRDECNQWAKIDAIKLFNALSCIVWILKKM